MQEIKDFVWKHSGNKTKENNQENDITAMKSSWVISHVNMDAWCQTLKIEPVSKTMELHI
jgi:hypothetical protein